LLWRSTADWMIVKPFSEDYHIISYHIISYHIFLCSRIKQIVSTVCSAWARRTWLQRSTYCRLEIKIRNMAMIQLHRIQIWWASFQYLGDGDYDVKRRELSLSMRSVYYRRYRTCFSCVVGVARDLPSRPASARASVSSNITHRIREGNPIGGDQPQFFLDTPWSDPIWVSKYVHYTCYITFV